MGATGASAFTMGGTAMESGKPQKEYWQKTKLDKDGGRPDACLIETRHTI